MDEPSFLLRAVTWHFGSGDALFTACLLLLLAIGWQARGGCASRVTALAFLSLVWMSLAAWPSFIFYWTLILLTSGWLLAMHIRYLGPLKAWRNAVIFAVLLAAITEIPADWPVVNLAPNASSVAILGDSVTAGLNAGDHTWPRQLAEATGRTVYDASQQGATVKSALMQLEKLDGRGEVLWIEIGGNDILESLSVGVYAERLDELLHAATKRYKTVVVMEIPAPPGGGQYGYEQRRLASTYRIPLVPKRQFVGVLTSRGGTQDGVHLANQGHRRMADVVQYALGWRRSGAGKDNGHYIRCE